jgi:hypothetical protein
MAPARTYTYTHTRFFDAEQVDELVGGAYAALSSDLERRREHMPKEVADAADHRLELLRHTWALLLDEAD